MGSNRGYIFPLPSCAGCQDSTGILNMQKCERLGFSSIGLGASVWGRRSYLRRLNPDRGMNPKPKTINPKP